MDTKDRLNRIAIFLQTVSDAVNELKISNLEITDDVSFYTLATEWTNVMGMVEELIKSQEIMSEHEQEKLRDLLKDLETVKPLVEKYHLTWYRR
jgi:hypothetical protein